jgi:hypothetical protein
MKFVQDNELLYIGESSALADINIKEVVETLMESNYKFVELTLIHRYSWSVTKGLREKSIELP